MNGFGHILTVFILHSVAVIKLRKGGWITFLITGSLVAVAVLIKRFYSQTQKKLARLDHLMVAVAVAEAAPAKGRSRRKRPRPPFASGDSVAGGTRGFP